jgi:hypothetical protein
MENTYRVSPCSYHLSRRTDACLKQLVRSLLYSNKEFPESPETRESSAWVMYISREIASNLYQCDFQLESLNN